MRTAAVILVVAACAAPAPELPANRAGPAGPEATRDGGGEKIVFARFTDASGLAVGTEVKVAGIIVGEIAGFELERGRCRRCARVTMRVRGDLELLVSATVYKRATSTLGAFFIELDLGNAPATDLETAAIEDGGEIEHVVEEVSVDEVLRNLEP